MRTKIRYLLSASTFRRWWRTLRGSYWFIPALMCVAAIGFSYLLPYLDDLIVGGGRDVPGWIYGGGVQGARALLSAIAGSMITVASLTFSITLAALSSSAQQYGPRLLDKFMRDTGYQVVLGTFVANFLYSLMVLRQIRDVEGDVVLPRLAVSFAVLLAIAALALLIYFFHHAAASMRVSHLLSSIGRELFSALDTQMDETTQANGDGTAGARKRRHARFPADGKMLQSERSGYLETVDIGGLKKAAREEDVVIRVMARPGDFVLEGADLVEVAPAGKATPELAEEVLGAFTFGANRFMVGEVESAAGELVEIAVRALSPGVNNPNTAIECLDQLVAALSHAIQRQVELRRAGIETDAGASDVGDARPDETADAAGALPVAATAHFVEGELRLVTPRLGLPGLVTLTFDEIRHHSRGTPTVQLRLIEAVAGLLSMDVDDATRNALFHQAEMIKRAVPDIPEADDREAILSLCKAVLKGGRQLRPSA